MSPLENPAAEGPFVAPAPAALGQLFPGLEVLAFIGQGGLGAVYRVRHEKLGRDMALKLVPRACGGDEAFSERFLREARALAGLSHPGITSVHDYGEAGPWLYLLMDYVAGGNLRALLRGGRVDPARAVAIAREIGDALAYAHARGIVHRDLRPENILLHERGQVSVADFGLLESLERREDPPPTETPQLIGAPSYMAPEQLEKPGEVGAAADVYSVGVILYEMLTGRLPLGRFPPPSMVAQSTAALDDVVLRALSQAPADRPASIEAFLAELHGAPSSSRARRTAGLGDSRRSLPVRSEEREARTFRPWVLGVAFLGTVLFLTSFLPWASVTLGHQVYAVNAWVVTALGMPVWLVLLPAILLVVFGYGEAAGLWAARTAAYALAAAAGGLWVALVIVVAVSGLPEGPSPSIGPFAALVLYGIAAWLPVRAGAGHRRRGRRRLSTGRE